MKIPETLASKKYYIGLSQTEAYSNWDTFDQAMNFMALYKKYRPSELKKIMGIFRVDSQGKKLVMVPAVLN